MLFVKNKNKFYIKSFKVYSFSSLAVHILPDQNMVFGGTNEPCAYVTLMSIGRLGIEENKKHSNAIMNELEKLLAIPPSRVQY